MLEEKSRGPRKDQQPFLLALLESASIAEATRKAGIDPKTAWRWLRDPDFARRLENERARGHAAAAEKAVVPDEPIDMLGQMLHSEDEVLRLEAARAILSLGQLTDAQLRRRLAAARAGHWPLLLPEPRAEEDDFDDDDDDNDDDDWDELVQQSLDQFERALLAKRPNTTQSSEPVAG